MSHSFTIRVYGICLQNNKILCLREMYAGERLLKLPGGGLEYGEGTLECLQREFREELNLEIENICHFYTQEDFVLSRFRAQEQLFTIYYHCDIKNILQLQISDPEIENAEWISLTSENPFTLPVDRLIFEKLKI